MRRLLAWGGLIVVGALFLRSLGPATDPPAAPGRTHREGGAPQARAAGAGGRAAEGPSPTTVEADAGLPQGRPVGDVEAPLGPDGEAGPAVVVVQLWVRDDAGQAVPGARLRSSDCPTALVADDRGRATALVPAGLCHFQGARVDGLLFARGPWVEINAQPGVQNELEVFIPSERTGGMGVALEVVDGGFALSVIHPGLPADQAGLELGDVLLAVDGEPTADLNLEQVAARLSGPEGSRVTVRVRHAGDTGLIDREIELTRAYLPANLVAAPDPR